MFQRTRTLLTLIEAVALPTAIFGDLMSIAPIYLIMSWCTHKTDTLQPSPPFKVGQRPCRQACFQSEVRVVSHTPQMALHHFLPPSWTMPKNRLAYPEYPESMSAVDHSEMQTKYASCQQPDAHNDVDLHPASCARQQQSKLNCQPSAQLAWQRALVTRPQNSSARKKKTLSFVPIFA